MIEPYRSTAQLAKFTVAVLALSCFLSAIGLALDVMTLKVLSDVAAGSEAAYEVLVWLDTPRTVVGGFIDFLLLLTAVPFLLWLYLASRDLHALGIDNLRTSPTWAVGWWVVPLANLVIPPRIMGDLWRASDPEATPDNWRNRKLSQWVGLWWALFLLAHFCGVAVQVAGKTMEDLSDLELLVWLDLLRGMSWILAGVLVIGIVQQISERQGRRAAILPMPAEPPLSFSQSET